MLSPSLHRLPSLPIPFRPSPSHTSQVILTVPDKGRVTAVTLGGKDKGTLYAFCGSKIWKRKIQQYALAVWSSWTKVVPTKL